MIRLRRNRFHELASRQLDLFAAGEGDLLEDARTAEDAWNRTGRDDAEEAYADWQLVADAIAERLLDLREAYASTLDAATALEYRAAFDRAANSRFPRFTELLG